MKIILGRDCDIDQWMQLVEKVKENFPGLETSHAMDEHKNTVLAFMDENSVICAKENNKIVGALLFSKNDSELCFLAVDPEFRRQHIGEKMVTYMLSFLNPEKEIVVTTYRDGVSEGVAARAFYKQLGFTEGKLCEVFGAPVQEFVLKRKED